MTRKKVDPKRHRGPKIELASHCGCHGVVGAPRFAVLAGNTDDGPSKTCRYRETAALLALGPATDLRALNSFFERSGQRGLQSVALRRWIAEQALAGMPVLLVTHQVNSAALTGTQPTSSELVIFKRIPDGSLSVAGALVME